MQAGLSEATPAPDSYGLFGLNGVQFVVDHQHIQSVLQCKGLKPLVHDSQALMGAIRYQGVDVPVVDMRRLMNFPEQSQPRELFVLIVRVQQGCLGVLCDEVLDILARQSCVQLKSFASDAHTPQVFKVNQLFVEQQQQPYTLLDVECLLHKFDLPWAPFLGLSNDRDPDAHQPKTWLVFELAHLRMAIQADCARATYFDLNIEADWQQSELYVGHVTLENRRLPVLDLAAVLGIPRGGSPRAAACHLVELEWGGSSALFVVDRVRDVLSVFPHQLAAAHFKHHGLAGLVSCSFEHAELGVVLTLNVDALVNKPEYRQLVESFPTEVAVPQVHPLDLGGYSGGVAAHVGLSQEYMLVRCPDLCAIPLERVQQVFQMSPDLLCARQIMAWKHSSIEVLTHADLDVQAQAMSLDEATHVLVLSDSGRHFGLSVLELCGIERGGPLSDTTSPRGHKLAKISLKGKLEFVQLL